MIDLSAALESAKQAALAAGQRIKAGMQEELNVEIKTDAADKLTIVDKEAQEIIVETITAAYPSHSLLGEESLNKQGSDETYRWVIDPLDGTSNFTRRLPHCGTSIALQENGESVLGVINMPMLNETYWAIKGKGAFCNDRPIKVSDCKKIEDAYLAEIFSDRMHRGKQITVPPCTAYRRFGSAIACMCYVASGKIDGTALRCFRWDIAAAEILIKEAGGKIEINYDEPGNDLSVISCTASTPAIFEEVDELAKKAFGS